MKEITTATKINRYYVHIDHLGTPQQLSDENGIVVCKASYQPFGEVLVNADVDGDGNATVMNVRFPGQYFDAESGNHYNYYRDYNPSIGRYVQSDPIGLVGGVNTYAYVEGNPIRFIDLPGLLKNCVLEVCTAVCNLVFEYNVRPEYEAGINADTSFCKFSKAPSLCEASAMFPAYYEHYKRDKERDKCIEYCEEDCAEKPCD